MNGGNYFSGAAGFTDTGQWRLFISIASGGVSAFLKNLVDPDQPPVALFKRHWEGREEDLLANIESAVYDNPGMLDDFSTHIVVSAPRSLWIPAEYVEDGEFDENLFTAVYPAEPEDIHLDSDDDVCACAYTLVPGLNSFLQRTLPGCKVSSHLSVLKAALGRREQSLSAASGADRRALYLILHEGLADIFAFSGGDFLCAASRSLSNQSDLIYFLLLTANACSFPLKELSLTVVASPSEAEAVAVKACNFFPSTEYAEFPAGEVLSDFPLATAVAAGYTFL